MSRGNRRWVLIGGAGFAKGAPIGTVYHYVGFPRFVGDRLKTACGIELPESYGLFWGPNHPRCEDCLVMKKVESEAKQK